MVHLVADIVPQHNFLRRLITALVLLPPMLSAIYYGGNFFNIVIAVGAIILTWEWNRLCGRGLGPLAFMVTTTTVAAVALTALGSPQQAMLLLVLTGVAVIVLTMVVHKAAPDNVTPYFAPPVWLVGGLMYIGLPCIALVWLRNGLEQGQGIVFWLFAVVWAVDIGAYFFGRAIGGPKLAPSISPNKTWAGLLGGMACAGVVGALTANMLGKDDGGALIAISASLAVVEQVGDLVESWIKRSFSVKDMGSLIPGHGGLFDRVDGLLAAALAVALMTLAGGGKLFEWL
jgi:phosphatidate cytidylyltransferase